MRLIIRQNKPLFEPCQPQIDVQQSELLAKVGAARLSTATNIK
jgi:hypothetical protein